MNRVRQSIIVGVLLMTTLARSPGDSFTGIGQISKNPFVDYSEAFDVSADGTVVVGQSSTSSTTDDDQAFRWTRAGGMVGLGYLPLGDEKESFAQGVSGDGSVVVGFGFDGGTGESQAFRWTSAGGLQELGDLPGGFDRSRALGVSGNGLLVVGNSSATFGDLGFSWTSPGAMTPIMDLPGGFDNSTAEAVSSDGTVIVGQSTSSQGSEAFRLAGSVIEGLGDLPGGTYESIAQGVSADGNTVVGFGNAATGREAFRWTEADRMLGLGFVGGGAFQRSEARDVTADGSTVVGYSATASDGQQAFIWDEVAGMRSLKEELEFGYGLDLTGWDLLDARGISDDGSVIVGRGAGPNGLEAWVAEITPRVIVRPPTTTWEFSGPVGQNEVDLPGTNFFGLDLNDVLQGSFSIGQNGSDATFSPPGSYSFSGLGMFGVISWENRFVSTKPTASPIVVSFRDNAAASAAELAVINFYLGTNLPSGTAFDIAAVETNISDAFGDHEFEFGVILVSRDLSLLNGTAYRPLPDLDEVDLAFYFVVESQWDEVRFSATGQITEWHGPVEEIVITEITRSAGRLIIEYSATPNVVSWKLKGSTDLATGFPDDLTSDPTTSFRESPAGSGNYIAETGVAALPSQYFIRIEN